MVKKILKDNLIFLVLLIVLLLLSISGKMFFYDEILKFDISISDFFQLNLVNDNNTSFMKVITFFGDAIAFIIIIVCSFIFLKNKSYSFYMMVNLLWTFLISVIFKNIIMRERPMISLIEKPSDFSFPSGHTMCAVAFYGFIIYLLVKNVKNYFLKWLIVFAFSMLIIFVGISRIYLNVHYFTDVVGGALLGLICLFMMINIYKKNYN